MAGNVLLITGAGASRNLGERDRPLMLMNEWAPDLVGRISAKDAGLARTIGLDPSLGGEDFERCLGRFLSWQRSLVTVADLQALGEEEMGQAGSAQFPAWLNRARARASMVVDSVYESMFENFGDTRIWPSGAAEVYGALLENLGLDGSSKLIVATTNYDGSITEALTLLDRRPDWGQEGQTLAAGATAKINISGLTELANAGRTPVLYLHGRVGWYRNESNALVAMPPNTPYNKEIGLPGLLLPEPEKEYDKDPVFAAMWSEFEKAVAQATRILVLGHSLHDERLVRALRGREVVTRIVGWSPSWDEWPKCEEDLKSRLGANCLRLDFGPQMDIKAAGAFLANWVTTS